MLAISFHILATINVNGVNLRVGPSDFLLPVLIAMMVWVWVRNSGAKFENRLPHLWAWLSAMMYCLTLLRTDRGKQADPLATGMLGIGLVFLGASVGTEVMYQRYFRFLLGLALFLPSMSDQSRTSSSLGSFRTEQSGAVSAIGSA